MVPPLALPVLVRTAHVLAATVVVGGAALAWAALTVATRRPVASAPGSPDPGTNPANATTGGGSAHPSGSLDVATAYEWLFWGAAGVLVATGVGNLGAFAPAIPGGRWGAILAVKLAVLLAALVGSFARTRLLRRARGADAGSGPSTEAVGDAGRVSLDTLRRAYALTTVGFVAVAVLAVVLAHG